MKSDPSNIFIKSLHKLSKSLLNQHTLIIGEAGTGKTLFTAFFLAKLLEQRTYPLQSITILDFGPPKVLIDNKWIGGRIEDYIALLSPEFPKINAILQQIVVLPENGRLKVRAPRISSHSMDEIFQLCLENYQITSRALLYYLNEPTPVLIINDVSIYLHLGGIHLLLAAIKKSKTALINGYAGNILLNDHESGISARESSIMRLLAHHCQYLHTDSTWANAMQTFYQRIASK
jgi:hypothetical protein